MGNYICESCGLMGTSKEVRLIGESYICNNCFKEKHKEKIYRETLFKMAICPTCGKEFIVPVGNIFKITAKDRVWHFCKYTCKTKAEREIPMFKPKKVLYTLD